MNGVASAAARRWKDQDFIEIPDFLLEYPEIFSVVVDLQGLPQVQCSASRPPPSARCDPPADEEVGLASVGEYDYFPPIEFETRLPVPPPWTLRFGRAFLKDAKQLDNNLKGRAMAALIELCQMPWPFLPRGDTLKQLHGDLQGFWRYRLGDWRLIVHPQAKDCRLDAVALAPRGSAYD